MDSRTDNLVQTIVTWRNARLKPVMRFSCVLSECFVCTQAKEWASNTVQSGKLSYRQPHHALNSARQIWPPHIKQVLCVRVPSVFTRAFWPHKQKEPRLLTTQNILDLKDPHSVSRHTISKQSIAVSPLKVTKVSCTVQQIGCRTFLWGGVEITPFEMYDCTSRHLGRCKLGYSFGALWDGVLG